IRDPGGVALGMRNAPHYSAGDRVPDLHEDDREGPGQLLHCPCYRPTIGDDDVGSEVYQLSRVPTDTNEVASIEANVEPQVPAFDPAELLQLLPQGGKIGLIYGVALRTKQQHAAPPHAPVLLRARRDGQRSYQAANQCDDLAPSHSRAFSAR